MRRQTFLQAHVMSGFAKVQVTIIGIMYILPGPRLAVSPCLLTSHAVVIEISIQV